MHIYLWNTGKVKTKNHLLKQKQDECTFAFLVFVFVFFFANSPHTPPCTTHNYWRASGESRGPLEETWPSLASQSPGSPSQHSWLEDTSLELLRWWDPVQCLPTQMVYRRKTILIMNHVLREGRVKGKRSVREGREAQWQILPCCERRKEGLKMPSWNLEGMTEPAI